MNRTSPSPPLPARRSRALPHLALLCAAIVGLAGCGSASGLRLYVNPDADMTFYKRVAVLPFVNLSPDGYAGARITRAFTTELIIRQRFDVVEEAQFRSALLSAAAEPDPQGIYNPEAVKKVAEEVKANALIKGVVTEYQMQRIGNSDAPVVTFEVEMVDLETGSTVWRGSITRRGESGFPIVGGDGTKTFGRLVQEACREMIDKLESEAF